LVYCIAVLTLYFACKSKHGGLIYERFVRPNSWAKLIQNDSE